jgi:hypothetical protein
MKRAWWISLFLQSCLSAVPVIKYKIPDGMQSASYIGNIGQDGHVMFDSSRDRTFQIVKGFELLQIDPKSGDLRTSAPIDREDLCDREAPRCVFDAEIITNIHEYQSNGQSQSLFKLFKVELEIEDLNDNSPIFPKDKIEIFLSEEAQIGHIIRLDSASDADSIPFGVSSYTLKDQSHPRYFSLTERHLADGSLVPQLILDRPLDHEKIKALSLTLTAHDGGTPSLSGSTEIIVHVIDKNDNPPTFSQSEYSISVAENLKKIQKYFNLMRLIWTRENLELSDIHMAHLSLLQLEKYSTLTRSLA